MRQYGHPQPNSKLTYDYYSHFFNESAYIQQELQAFGSALSKTSIALILRQTKIHRLTLKQTKDIHQMVTTMMAKISQRIQKECSTIIGVAASIRKINGQIRQIVDLAKAEEDRTLKKILEYQDQIASNEKELKKCQSILEEQRNRQLELRWRKLHYIDQERQDKGNHMGGEMYMKVLKDINDKLQYHLSTQRKQQALFSDNIKSKVADLKVKMSQACKASPISQLTPFNNRVKEELSNLEREYIKKEKDIDGFKIEQLGEIKKKLKILEEAEMSESRDYRMCFNDNHIVVESEVVEILNN